MDKIRHYLQQIYPVGPAYEKLVALINRTHIPPRQRDSLFSERDVTLITYGNTLRREGEAPLKSLHGFAETRLKGVVSTIHILPFFPYSSDDGFSVIDYFAVDPALGTWADVNALGDDFALMFDAVINHMSAQSDWFRQFLAGNPEFENAFITEAPETDLSSITRPRTSPLLTPFEKANGETAHVWTTFSADQVDLNYADPDTLLRVMEVMLFYAQQGATVIRLDAIAYLWKKVGTSSIHLPETHAVVQLMRAVFDILAPHMVIITETNVPHAENISYFGDGIDEAQMVYNFTLPPLLFYTVLSGDVSKLRDWVNTLTTPSEQTTFFNFTASHDGIGVRPVEGILTAAELQTMIDHVEASGGRGSYKTNSDGSRSPYELNVTYIDALTDPSEPEDMQVKRFLMSQALAMSLAGVPAVYIHSLLGSRNYGEGVERSGHNRTINREKLDADSVEKALGNANSFRAKIFDGYTALLKKRVAQAAFHPNAAQAAVDMGNNQIFGLRRGDDLLCLFNVSGSEQTVETTVETRLDLISGAFYGRTISMKPYQVMWLITQSAAG